MHFTCMCTQVQRSQMIHIPHMKDVPREMMISSNSIRLLHSVGEGTSILYKSVSMFYCLLISSTPNNTTSFTHDYSSGFQLDHVLSRLPQLTYFFFTGLFLGHSLGANMAYVNTMVKKVHHSAEDRTLAQQVFCPASCCHSLL